MLYKLNYKTVFLFYFVFLIISFISCIQENSTPTTPPASGTVSGSVSPSTAVTSVSLDTVTGGQKYLETPNPDGTFKFSSVLPGQYKLRVMPITIYNMPTQVSVSVTLGNTTTIPVINLSYNTAAQTGIVNFGLDGTPYTIYYNELFLTYSSFIFNLTGGTPSIPSYYYFDLKLNSISVAGTYNISNSPSYISIFYYTSPGNNAGYWSTNNGGAGTVNITTLNTTTRTASGTFSGTLVPQGVSVGTKQINGTFTNVLY